MKGRRELISKMEEVIKHEPSPQKAFWEVLRLANDSQPSPVWETFQEMKFTSDILEANVWLRRALHKHPETTGIYLGLDTLNMNDGRGTNIEIGLSSKCSPEVLDAEWAFHCEQYGDSHLIRSLSEVSASFSETENWPEKIGFFAEYIIFLAYSGIIIREALEKLKINKDHLVFWGFHGGDMFFLLQQVDGKISLFPGNQS